MVTGPLEMLKMDGPFSEYKFAHNLALSEAQTVLQKDWVINMGVDIHAAHSPRMIDWKYRCVECDIDLGDAFNAIRHPMEMVMNSICEKE